MKKRQAKSVEDAELSLILNPNHESILSDNTRFQVINAGRGFGKTQIILGIIFKHLQTSYTDAYGTPLKHKIWYVAPTYKQGKKIFWQRLKAFFAPLTVSKNESELTIILYNGAEITIVGSDQSDNLRGPYLTLCIFDEAAFHKQKYWSRIIRPMLGRVMPLGTAAWLSTPQGRNEFYDLAQRGRSSKFRSWSYHHFTTLDGGFVPESEIVEAKSEMTYEEWRQEYYGEFITPTNMVYFKFDKDKHHKRINHVPDLTIHWAWDFNVKPACHSTLFHSHKSKVFVFDEICVGNTPNNVDEFCERYPKEKVSEIKLYGDYNGTLGTNGTTDFMEIQKTLYDRGYPYPELCVYGGNPIVRSRTNNVNRLLEDANRDIHIYVDTEKCPKLTKDFEQVRWAEKSADIDKSTDPTLTHSSDGFGYAMWVMFPPEWADKKGRPQREPQKSEQYSSGGYWL